MDYFDERLKTLQADISRKKKLDAQAKDLLLQKEELEARVHILMEERNMEQYDVTELESLSFASIWAKITGTLEEKLDKEKKEALAAAAKYSACKKDLLAVKEEILRVHDELKALEGCEKEYEKVLFEKRKSMAEAGDEQAKKLLELDEKIGYFKNQQKELLEAYDAGREAMDVANEMSNHLSSAKGWATWDLIGGGLVTDMMKHNHMNQAQSLVRELQDALRCFRTELADVTVDDDLDFQMDGFTSFADVFFDNIFFDLMAYQRIQTSDQQVNNTKNQIGVAISKIEELLDAVEEEIRTLEDERKGVVL